MKKFIDKKLVLALLMSVSGLYASGDGMSMSYFRQSLNFLGRTAQQGLTFVGRQVGSTVKNHPYITMAVLAYEVSMRYYGLSNWTPSHGVSLLSKKLVDRVRALKLATKPLPATPCKSATTVKNVPETPDKPVEKIKPSSTALCKSEVVVAKQQELKDLLEGLSNGSVAISNDSEVIFVSLCKDLLEEEDVARLERLFHCFNNGGPMAGTYRASIIMLLRKAVGNHG